MKNGNTKRKPIQRAPIHELVHIGIEEPIVKRFSLTHSEKERIVDKICMLKFKKEMPKYYIRKLWDIRVDKFVTKETLDMDLVKAISGYVKNYPR